MYFCCCDKPSPYSIDQPIYKLHGKTLDRIHSTLAQLEQRKTIHIWIWKTIRCKPQSKNLSDSSWFRTDVPF